VSRPTSGFHQLSFAVYHWASITAGRYGRVCGWFAGYWNLLAWSLGGCSITAILGNQTVAMYGLFHPNFVAQPWHVFVSYIICTWLCCCIVLFANRILPALNDLGIFFVVGGVVVTIIVCATLPHVNGTGYASNAFVWSEWVNNTGYKSDGFVFLLGMLNGAYAVGTPDCVTHLAEEIPRPSANIPKAILAQMSLGFLTAFFYLIAIFYAVNDLDTVLSASTTFPLAEIYVQATNSAGGALGLLIVAFIPTFLTLVGCYLTAGRMFWTLARDNATPASRYFSRVSPTFNNPFRATVLIGIFTTILGCIYVGSTTAFNAFIGSFIILSTLSYLAAILPHLLSGRKNTPQGYFWMKGPIGFVVNAVSCLYIMAFIVIFCFPFALPVDAQSMNYACLITGGLTIFVALWWFVRQGSYIGPQAVPLHSEALAKDAI